MPVKSIEKQKANMQKNTPDLPLAIQLGWATGELGIAAYIGVTMGYMLFYLTQALDISPVWAGVAIFVPRLWDVITDPVMGAISDQTKSRMGRRRPYLLIGSLSFGVFFTLIFFTPVDAPEITKIIYFTLFYFLTSTAFTIYDVPYSSMGAEMTNDYKARTTLTGFKMMAARIGIVLAVTITPWLLQKGETLAQGFQTMGILFGAFMVITGLISFFTTRDAPRREMPPHKFNIKSEFQAIRQNKPFRILWLIFFMQNLAIGVSSTTLVYFVIFVMKVDLALIGPMVLTAAVSATIATPGWVLVARHYGKRETYFIGLAIASIMTLPILFITADYLFFLFIIFLLTGIGDAANQLASNAMVPDTVEVDEAKTGNRREGAIFGAWAFCRKLGMATGAFLVSISLSIFGFEGGNGTTMIPDETALLGIRITYAVLPCILWICAIIILRKYTLNEREFNKLKTSLKN